MAIILDKINTTLNQQPQETFFGQLFKTNLPLTKADFKSIKTKNFTVFVSCFVLLVSFYASVHSTLGFGWIVYGKITYNFSLFP